MAEENVVIEVDETEIEGQELDMDVEPTEEDIAEAEASEENEVEEA